MLFLFFFFNDPATPEIYTLSLHDALPISAGRVRLAVRHGRLGDRGTERLGRGRGLRVLGAHLLGQLLRDRKSTRLNSSHPSISYAVFCLKKKNTKTGKYKDNM